MSDQVLVGGLGCGYEKLESGYKSSVGALLCRLATDPAADHPADLAGLVELERQRPRPKAKQRAATFSERSPSAPSVRRHVGYKCLLCAALGWPPLGLRRPNGVPCVEVHQVDPVANRSPGALRLASLLTVGANHHRKPHYGNARLLRQTATQFRFELYGQPVTVGKPRLAGAAATVRD